MIFYCHYLTCGYVEADCKDEAKRKMCEHIKEIIEADDIRVAEPLEDEDTEGYDVPGKRY